MVMEVSIIDTTTGETRTFHEADEEADEWPPFNWTEGNYSCDCNRALFFVRAKNEEDPNIPCGEERFKVRLQQGELTCEC